MKSFAVLCILFAIAASKPASDAQAEIFKALHKECAQTSGVTYETVMGGEFPDEPNFKDHMLCISKKMGVMTDEGKIDVDSLTATAGAYLEDDAKAAAIVAECGKDQESPAQTAFVMAKCFHDKNKDFE